MEFVQCTIDDHLDEIFEIANEAFDQFYPREKFLKKIFGKKYWAYLAKEGGFAVGFKIFYEDTDNEIYSWLGGVKPSFRRRGIASELMKIEINLAKKEGYSKIKLTTHEGHPEMIALCKKFGFAEVGREVDHWKGLIDKEAVFFELDLIRNCN